MRSAVQTPSYKPPVPAIRIGTADKPDHETRFGVMLVWFMRLLSVLWVGQGLLHWSSILVSDADGAGALETVSGMGAAAMIFFSVIDLVAAVGLWLASPWGGVVWLVAVGAQWVTTLILPHFFAYDRLFGMLDLALTAAYFWLTYRAAVENEPYV